MASNPVDNADSPSDSAAADPIRNEEFCAQLEKLRHLRTFLVTHNIKDDTKESKLADLKLGKLNSLERGDNGREPSDSEWDELNSKLQYGYGLLSDAERRKFNFGLAAPTLRLTHPKAFVGISLLFLLIPAIVRLLIPNIFGGDPVTDQIFRWVALVCFLGWIMAVGVLGAIAFILVNALGIQVDPTVDVTDKESTAFRVLLGALFSVVLSLPFSFPSFLHFHEQILRADTAVFDPKEAMLLLMPFLFGFSTSLVLTVLNRLVEAVQTFFGVSTRKP